VRSPDLVRGWFAKFGPERLILSPDVRLDTAGVPRIAAAGWQETTGVALDDFLAGYLSAGLLHILCTDISRDGKLTGPNSALYATLVKKFPSLQLQASGGVSSLDDLRATKTTGVSGVIVGRALYEKRFTLGEALTCE
jgi:phosphoribosylformimino-5-aminoimidazole carboxamide ribotide isomerase